MTNKVPSDESDEKSDGKFEIYPRRRTLPLICRTHSLSSKPTPTTTPNPKPSNGGLPTPRRRRRHRCQVERTTKPWWPEAFPSLRLQIRVHPPFPALPPPSTSSHRR
ncbi:hypothetical protein PIB30_096275, partial [Stylosanthes scabra]|nr:hypothetical protein [Stylosanthes scabra]